MERDELWYGLRNLPGHLAILSLQVSWPTVEETHREVPMEYQ